MHLRTSLIIGSLIFTILSGGGLWLFHWISTPFPAEVHLTIRPGDTAQQVSNKLAHYKGPRWMLGLYMRFLPMNKHLQVGEYHFPLPLCVSDLLRALMTGTHQVIYRFTLIEGSTVAEVVKALNTAPALIGEIHQVPPEGTLLPETYHYRFGESRESVLRQMQQAMQQQLTRLWQTKPEGFPLKTVEQALILASIVEKETAIEAERSRVAAVFLNRLKKGMRLQSDPTVAYSLTQGKKRLDRALTRQDLLIDNPYNTYVYSGLPPAPIANPGSASLKAVITSFPTDELYFVADGKGGHTFSKNLEEHKKHHNLLRKIRQQLKKPSLTEAPEKQDKTDRKK